VVEKEQNLEPEKEKSKEPNPPQLIPIDITYEVYQDAKNFHLKQQHPIVRPYLNEFFRWLKSLDALSVYDALEKGETVKTKYEEMKFNPIRISIAAARGLLKRNTTLRSKAQSAFSVQIARLVLRFENAGVWEVLKQFDPDEEFLRRNINAFKEIMGLIEVKED